MAWPPPSTPIRQFAGGSRSCSCASTARESRPSPRAGSTTQCRSAIRARCCTVVRSRSRVSSARAGPDSTIGPPSDARSSSSTMPRCKPLQLRSEEHTSELQSHHDLVCRLLLEKKKKPKKIPKKIQKKKHILES